MSESRSHHVPARDHQSRSNAFALVAVAGALLVSIRHGAIIAGPDSGLEHLAQVPAIGIFVLLGISGYLVAGSWERDPHLGRFLVRRAVRIWAPLVVVLVLSAYLLGPIATSLPIGEYLTHPGTLGYVTANATLEPRFALPAVFEDTPIGPTVNGTLWSIPLQVAGYVLIGALGLLFPARIRTLVWVAVAIVCIVLLETGALDGTVWRGVAFMQWLLPGISIAVGAAAAALRSHGWPTLATGATLLLADIALPAVDWVLPIACTLLAIGMGTWRTPRWLGFATRRNVSFGIFLLGFPVQQLLEHMLPTLPSTATLLLGTLGTIGLAIVLERLVETPTRRATNMLLDRRSRRARASSERAV